MRLIDADCLQFDIPENPSLVAAIITKTIQEAIESIPTVDAVPVVHGRWVDRPVNVGTPTTDLFCSECDFPAWKYKYNYCPNCGAKMDGG